MHTAIRNVLICFLVLTVIKRNFCTVENVLKSEIGNMQAEIGKAMRAVIINYFSDFPCIGIITENSSNLMDFVPNNVTVVKIGIGADKLSHIEEKDTFVSEGLDESTQFFERLIAEAMDYRCYGYIVEVSNYRSFVFSFSRATRRTMQRFNSRILFIPKLNDDKIVNCEDEIKSENPGHFEDILRLKQLEMLPDIVAMEIKISCSSPLDLYNGRNIPQTLNSNLNVTESMADLHNTSSEYLEVVDYNTSEVMKNVVYTIKFVTRKFVTEDASEKIFLDMWISEKEELKFDNLFPNKILNLQGKQLIVATVDYKPYALLSVRPGFYDGLEIRIIKELSRILNFTWKPVVDEVYLWGSIFLNGSGNGIVGYVSEEKANFGFAGLYGTWHYVWTWVDFTASYITGAVTGVMPAPKLQPRWHTLIWPFSNGIWLAVGVTFLVSTAGIYVVAKFSDKYLKATGTVGPYTNLINCAFQMFGLLVLQVYEGNDEDRYVILRMLTTFLDFVIFTLSSIYTGGLASVLTIPRYNDPIDTLAELAESNLLWAAQDEAFVWSLYDSHDPVVEKIVVNFRVWKDDELAVLALKAESGFVMEVIYGGICSRSPHLNDEAMAKLRIMSEPMYWAHVITVTQKSSPYTSYFNNLVHRLRESGIILFWQGEVARQYDSGCGSGPEYDSGPTNLTIDHVQGAFILLGMGVMLSGLIFIWENVKSKFYKKYFQSAGKSEEKKMESDKKIVRFSSDVD